MTDRYNALTVVLDRDIREDDAESILAAIRMVRGVLSVTPHVSDFTTHIAEQRVRNELGTKILAILYPESTP